MSEAFSESILRRLREMFSQGEAPVDAVCLYRAGLGTILFGISLLWLPHTTELFSSETFHLGPLSDHAPAPSMAFALCVALAITSLGVALGFLTRLSLLVTLGLWTFLYAIDTINEKLARVQTIKRFAIIPREFTIEGGELTPTMKVKRKVVNEKYKVEIEALYPSEEGEGVSAQA